MSAGTAGGRALDARSLETLEHYFGVPLDAAHPVLEEVETRRLAGGEWLMHQGDEGRSLYFLVRGRLQAWAREGDLERGRFLNEVVPGDSIGELSLLTGAPRSVGIQAIRDSLLLRIDRSSFEKLAHAYPALALKLAANVATLLQSSARPRPSTRDLRAICLLALDSTPRVEAFSRAFVEQLESRADVLALDPDRLGEQGAPLAALPDGEEAPPALSNWLQDCEGAHRFLLYRCGPDNLSWARYALRQSDMVLFVGDAEQSPGLRDWEARLDREAGGGIARRLLVLLQPGSQRPIRDTAAWLNVRAVDFQVHVRDGVAADLGRVVRIVSGRALGLVLAGGAARGFVHLGVYRAMRERKMPVDWIGGTSVGAIMAATLASPHSLEEATAMLREAFVVGKPFGDVTVPVFSLIRGKRIQRLLRKYLDLMIEDLPTPFFCVSCHLDTGSMKLHERGYLPDALAASAAIPGIIPPAVVDGRLAVDGSVVNNLPVDVMQRKPVGTVIAVDLSADSELPVDYERLPSPWAVLRGRYVPFSRRYRVPGLSTVLLKATQLGTLDRVRRQGAQADLLLSPEVRQFGLTEVKAFDRVVEAGYRYACGALDEWLERCGRPWEGSG